MGDAKPFMAAVPERSGPEGTGAADLSGAAQGGGRVGGLNSCARRLLGGREK